MTNEFRTECANENVGDLWNKSILDNCPSCEHVMMVHSWKGCDMCKLEERVGNLLGFATAGRK